MTKLMFDVFAGLGIFLIGLKFMSNGLQDLAGKKIKEWINKATKTSIHGLILGILVTGLLQSSSGTTALIVALVAGGMMTFKQAASVILGANIGTTITAFLIGFKISTFAPLIIGVGAFMFMFSKRAKYKHFATALLGFGFIFFGLKYMGSPLKDLSKEVWFGDAVSALSKNSVLAFFSGSFLTALVQSSSAFIGITQEMYANGAITLVVAVPFVLGANIGTTITAIMASWGSGKRAKQAALFHFMMNFAFGLIALALIIPYTGLVEMIRDSGAINEESQLAIAHGIFNVVMALIALPFLSKICNLVEHIIKVEDVAGGDYTLPEEQLIYENPVMAIFAIRQSASQMTNLAIKALESSALYIETGNKEHIEMTRQYETATDNMRSSLNKYLRKITSLELAPKISKDVQWLTMCIKDLERVGDLSLDICELLSEIASSKKINLSEKATKELLALCGEVIKLGQKTHSYILKRTETGYKESKVIEDKIDDLAIKYKENHFKRISNNECSSMEKIDYTMIVAAYERIGDHFYNIFKGYKPTKIKAASKSTVKKTVKK